MRDEDKSREELLTELQRLRIQMAEMMEAETFCTQIERDLEQVTQIAAAIVRSSPCGLLIFHRQPPDRLTLLNGNPQAARLLDTTIDHMRGASFDDLWPDAADQYLKQGFWDTLDTGHAFEVAHAPGCKNAPQRTFSIRAFRLPEERLGVYLAEVPESHMHVPTGKAKDPQICTSAPMSYDACDAVDDVGAVPGDQDVSRGEEETGSVEDLISQVEDISARLAIAQESLMQETELRKAAEEVAATNTERTEEISAAKQSLERQVSESLAREEALRAVQYNLESRLKVQENEIRELTETLEIEIEEHKKTEERLVAARIALESRMTEVDEEVEAANEELRFQMRERQRVEAALRSELADREALLEELTERLSEATECLDREMARRDQRESSLSGERPAPVPLQHSFLGYASFDSQGEITAFNPRLMHMLGVRSAEELRDLNVRASGFLGEAIGAEAVKQCLQLGLASTCEGRFINASTEQVQARIHLAPLWNEREEIVGCEALLEDASIHSVMQGTLIRSERLNALSRMAGHVAEKLNNLVGTVSEHCQAALTCVESASLSDMVPLLETMLGKSRDAARTARRIRQFARMRPRMETRQPHVFDLTDVVRESIEMDALWSRSPSADARDVVVEQFLEQGCHIQGAEEDFIEVMANVLENAVDALSLGGTLEVRTYVDRDTVVLHVRDNGVGMPPYSLVNLGEPFVTTKDGHDGLGLSVVFGIIRRHRGTLTVTSQPGGGTTISVKLPRAVRLPGEETPTGEEPAQGSCRLLLVYQLPPVARMIRNKLTRFGYTVFIAQSSEQAVETVQNTNIDAIVCDLGEDDGDMADVCDTIERLHREKGLAKPPIIVLVESIDRVTASGYLARCAVHRIVEKPVSVARLVEIAAEEMEDDATACPAIEWHEGKGPGFVS